MRIGVGTFSSEQAQGQGVLRGPELLTNGDFSQAGTGWSIGGSGITFGTGVCSFNTPTNDQIGQPVSALVPGVMYEVTFTMSNYVRGNAMVNVGGTVVTSVGSTNGVKQVRVLAGSQNGMFYIYGGPFGSGGQWDLTNLSVVACL